MCALFDYAGYAAVRAPVETKKKQDISSLHKYAGYAAARALVELKKKTRYIILLLILSVSQLRPYLAFSAR